MTRPSTAPGGRQTPAVAGPGPGPVGPAAGGGHAGVHPRGPPFQGRAAHRRGQVHRSPAAARRHGLGIGAVWPAPGRDDRGCIAARGGQRVPVRAALRSGAGRGHRQRGGVHHAGAGDDAGGDFVDYAVCGVRMRALYFGVHRGSVNGALALSGVWTAVPRSCRGFKTDGLVRIEHVLGELDGLTAAL